MKFLLVGDPHGVLPKKIPKGKFDAVLITGDLGKIDIARKIAFEKILGVHRDRAASLFTTQQQR